MSSLGVQITGGLWSDCRHASSILDRTRRCQPSARSTRGTVASQTAAPKVAAARCSMAGGGGGRKSRLPRLTVGPPVRPLVVDHAVRPSRLRSSTASRTARRARRASPCSRCRCRSSPAIGVRFTGARASRCRAERTVRPPRRSGPPTGHDPRRAVGELAVRFRRRHDRPVADLHAECGYRGRASTRAGTPATALGSASPCRWLGPRARVLVLGSVCG